MPNLPDINHPYHQLVAVCEKYNATLLAVSKTRSEKEIVNLYKKGQKIFGENRAHELIIKASLLPTDIEWHLIGHLQSNKVRSILPFVSCVQSLDSWKLWQKIQDESIQQQIIVKCLLQIKIATEPTKYGWDFEELIDIMESGQFKEFSNVSILGVMGMASLTANSEQVRNEFKQLKNHFDTLKSKFFRDQPGFTTISMGMSGDYQIALEEGSTMIRIGSLLFS